LASLAYTNAQSQTVTNRITTAGYEYDPAGNQTRGQTENGVWLRSKYDAAGRLAQVLTDTSAVLETYSYGATNERLVTTSNSGTSTFYAWEGGQVIAEYSNVGTTGLSWNKHYVYLGGRLLATTQASGTQYYHPDRLGTRLVTDGTSGTVVTEQANLPFGTALTGESSGASNNRRFTSYDRSTNTGLDYAVNRFYNAAQGRFTQVDPIGMASVSLTDPQTLNLYVYVGNDPINRIDPDGLFWKWVGNAFKAIGRAFKAAFKVLGNKWVRLGIAVALAVIGAGWASKLIIYNFSTGAPVGLTALGKVAGVLAGAQTAGALSSFLQQSGQGGFISDPDYVEFVGEQWSVLDNGEVLYEATVNVTACVTWGCVFKAIGKGIKVGARRGWDNVFGSPQKIAVAIFTGGRFRGTRGKKSTKHAKDYADGDTQNHSAHFNNEAEARVLARQKIGTDPIEVEPNKFRSKDGKWQYRAKPGDLNDNHIHLEEIDPATGKVKQNYHLRWKEGTERK
jgi:RHS repeat-associated protein